MKRKLEAMVVKNAKPKEKGYKLFDGGRLYLFVTKNNTKSWRFDFSYLGKSHTMVFGKYPTISLKEARQLHEQAIDDRDRGIDPRLRYKQSKLKPFSEYALELLARSEAREVTKKKKQQRLQKYCFPPLDKIPVTEINTLHLFEIVKPVLDDGKHEIARVLVIYLREVFSHLKALHLIKENPATDLKDTLVKRSKTSKPKHMPFTLNTKILAAFLKGFDNYNGNYVVKQALRFIPLVFLRPRNVRELKWSNIDLQNKLITFEPEEMKQGKTHYVPLSDQALTILKEVFLVNGGYKYVFTTATKGKDAPLTESTLSVAMNKIINPETGDPFGPGVMSPHGWRHTASTILNEMGFNGDVIEAQLAHQSANRIRAVYNKAEWMPERKEMLQQWANYLDTLNNKNNVITLRRKPAK